MKKDFISYDDFYNVINDLQQFDKRLNTLHNVGLDFINFLDSLYKVIDVLFRNSVPKSMYEDLISWWLYELSSKVIYEKNDNGEHTKEIKLETIEDLYDYCLDNLEFYKNLDLNETI